MDIYQILEKLNKIDNEATRAAVDQLKSLNKVEESTEMVAEKYMGFKKLEKSIAARGDVDNPAAVAAAIGRKKYGKEKFQKMAVAGKRESVEEADVEEGNEFTDALAKARASGAKEFKVDGKTYPVKESAEEVVEGFADFFDKKIMYKKIGADVDGKADDYTVTFKDGTRKRYQQIDGRRRVTTLEPIDRNDAVDDQGEVVKRGRGRPKGTGKKMGARGKTRVHEGDHDENEYDQEGEMAKTQLKTIEDAAAELASILSDDENLPEWVQSKITKAMDYLDTARDYMKANDEQDMADEEGDEEMEERKLTKGEMGKREKYVKGMKKAKGDFEKRYGDRGEEVMYATATKMAKNEDTTAGSVATAPAGGKAKGIFGKGVYESFEKEFAQRLDESMSVNVSADTQGNKTINVSASDAEADQLSSLLKMAGLFGSSGYKSMCSQCGEVDCSCSEAVEEEYSNSPETQTQDTEYMTNTISGGLNAQKTTGQTTAPVINRDKARQGVGAVKENIQSHLETLYKKYKD